MLRVHKRSSLGGLSDIIDQKCALVQLGSRERDRRDFYDSLRSRFWSSSSKGGPRVGRGI